MENTIGHGAIKIALFQVIPGYEWEVKEELAEACRKNSAIKKYAFLKGVGSFDIILIYATENFGNHLRKGGPIPNILKSNILLCFPYFNKNHEQIVESINNNIFTAFSLLKVSPGLKRDVPNIDRLLREYSKVEINQDWPILGSLGWNELIVIASEKKFEQITEAIFQFNKIVMIDGEHHISTMLKTFSFLGINYRQIPGLNIIKKGIQKTKQELQKVESLNTHVYSEKSQIYPTINITNKPLLTNITKNYFINKGFEPVDLIGKSDIKVKPRKQMLLSDFLAALLVFRHKYRGNIFDTFTEIGFDDKRRFKAKMDEIDTKISPHLFKYEDLVKIFNDDMASSLATQFYTLNSLFQNPLCGNVYVDMVKYPKYIEEAGNILKNDNKSEVKFAERCKESIRRGAELRSYGTFETLEDVTGRFSEYRGGCQISLLALEFFPSFLLDNLSIEWKGFIITGRPKFSHSNEIINVPVDTLWNPQDWWPLYHEIAHIIIERSPWEINRSNNIIRQFLANKDDPLFWIDNIIELTAEVVGFELGFFGDYDTYLKGLWSHLNKLDPLQGDQKPLSQYAIRTFFVKLFVEHFRSSPKKVKSKEFKNIDYI